MPQQGYDIDQIVTEFGAYYLDNKQNATRLIRALRMVTAYEADCMTQAISKETRYRAAERRMSELIQRFQRGWTPKGEIKLIPIEHQLEKIKMDYECMPDDIHDSWLGFLEGKSDLERKNWPFVRWIVEQELLPQVQEDWAEHVVYKGVQAAIVPGTAGDATGILDGVGEQRKIHFASGRITPIALGDPSGLTDEEYVEYIEAFMAGVDQRYRYKGGIVQVDPDYHLKYMRGFTKKYGDNKDINSLAASKVLHHKVVVKGYEEMMGRDEVNFTPKENLVVIKRPEQNDKKFQAESLKREVFIHNHYHKGVGINIPELFFTTDRNLV